MLWSVAMSFEYKLTARFYEVDRAGIIFYARFYEYAHAALEELLTQMFGHPAAIFEAHDFGMPLVHSEADYMAPTRMGDRLIVSLSIERVGKGSVTFAYDIRSEEGEHRCSVKLVHAFVDMKTFAAIPVPALFRDGLQNMGLIAPSS